MIGDISLNREEVKPAWLPIFISLMIVLLTLMVFLITFSESDSEKIKIFKRFLRENLMLVDKKSELNDRVFGDEQNPLKALINRMKAEGINKRLMDNYLTIAQIKKIRILDGEDGVCIILPERILFKEGSTKITRETVRPLNEVLPLVMDLPYIVEIRGYASIGEGKNFIDSLEFSSQRAYSIYQYFVSKGVAAEKLTVTGYGDNFSENGKKNNKVEIVFKEQDY
jgi:flagellar motor protein MotB